MIKEAGWLANYDLLTFETVDSTNTEALRFVKKGAIGDFVIVACNQTGGRGRRGRDWVSESGNLYMSILLESKVPASACQQLSFLIANIVHDSVECFAKDLGISLNIELKWPNDVLVNGKKLAGILLESINFYNRNHIIIGIGLNLAKTPESIKSRATSLHDEGFESINSDEFLNVLLNKFDISYRQWCVNQDFFSIREEWMQRAYNLGEVVTIDDGERRVSGVFKDIDSDGAIRLEFSSGEIGRFVSGSFYTRDRI